jgi:hypothetical protein
MRGFLDNLRSEPMFLAERQRLFVGACAGATRVIDEGLVA